MEGTGNYGWEPQAMCIRIGTIEKKSTARGEITEDVQFKTEDKQLEAAGAICNYGVLSLCGDLQRGELLE